MECENFCMHCQQNVEVSIYDEIIRCLDCYREINKLASVPEELEPSGDVIDRDADSRPSSFNSPELDIPESVETASDSPVVQFSSISLRTLLHHRFRGPRSTSTPPAAQSSPFGNLRTHPYGNALRARRFANSDSSSNPAPISSRTRSEDPFMLPEPANVHAQGISQVIIRFDRNGFAFQSRGGIQFTEDEIHDIVRHVLSSVIGQEGEDVQVGINPECFARIPVVEVSEKQVEDAAQCVTCMEKFKIKEKVSRLDCGHIYHHQCILPWLRLHKQCPLCRSVVDPENWKDSGDKNAKEVTKTDHSKEFTQLD